MRWPLDTFLLGSHNFMVMALGLVCEVAHSQKVQGPKLKAQMEMKLIKQAQSYVGKGYHVLSP